MTHNDKTILQFWAYRQLQSWLKTENLLQNFISYTKEKNLWKYIHRQVRGVLNIERLLVDAFWWRETKEGYTFWYHANRRWEEFLKAKAQGVYFFKSK